MKWTQLIEQTDFFFILLQEVIFLFNTTFHNVVVMELYVSSNFQKDKNLKTGRLHAFNFNMNASRFLIMIAGYKGYIYH